MLDFCVNLRHLCLIRAHHSVIDPLRGVGLRLVKPTARKACLYEPEAMASFEEIMRHMPQLDTQDRERDNPHRAGPENLSNLCGNLVELRWLWVEAWP